MSLGCWDDVLRSKDREARAETRRIDQAEESNMSTDATDRDERSSRRIQHTEPSIGPGARQPQREAASAGESDSEPLPIAESVGHAVGSRKITAFGKQRRHEDTWTRTPNTTGEGAIHVRTFHGKLTHEALAYMDQCVNEWLDAHPQYEVKLVNLTVGILTGKLKEPHLICQVWV